MIARAIIDETRENDRFNQKGTIMKMLSVVLIIFLAGCNAGTKYPNVSPIASAQADMVDTTSNNTRIDLDLSVAHTDARYTVKGRQIYYDLGLEPSKVGSISIKMNNVQSPSITLAPGGSITFDGLVDIFVTNIPQSGKTATLLINEDSIVSNNPTSPLSSGINANRYNIGLDINQILFHDNSIAGAVPLNGYVLYAADPVNSIVVRHLTLSVMCSSYLDKVYLYLIGPTLKFYTLIVAKNSDIVLDDFNIPAGWSLAISRGSTGAGPGWSNTANAGTVGISLYMIYQYI